MPVEPPALLTQTLPAVPESVPQLRSAVVRCATAIGAPPSTVEGVKLAVSDAVTNAVVHAYIDDERPGAIRVTATLEGGSLHVSVSDDGRGMRPRLDSPGLGLGLPLIAQTAETFDVHRAASGGTEVRMSFKLAD